MITYDPQNALHILLFRLFDYAGMFPPAKRAFEEALRESASLERTLQRPWMVGADLVLDTPHAAKLLSIDPLPYGFSNHINIALLAADDKRETVKILRDLSKHANLQPPHRRILSVEVKAPPEDFAALTDFFNEAIHDPHTELAFEPDLSLPEWQETLTKAIGALTSLSQPPALKCRCTGATGIGPEKLAQAIIATADAGVSLKVTGGLHHPVVEPERFGNAMGFLNVAAGVMLRRALGERVTHTALSELLTNQSIEAFSFGERLTYRGLSISRGELARARETTRFTIGSCSLHEPDDDLSRLGV